MGVREEAGGEAAQAEEEGNRVRAAQEWRQAFGEAAPSAFVAGKPRVYI